MRSLVQSNFWDEGLNTLKTVAVFGSRLVEPDSQEYQETRKLGQLLAEAGFTVATGAYKGVMEAASRGANEAGGHVIGVSTKEVEVLRGYKANEWVIEEFHYPTLNERLNHLVQHSDAYIATYGGIGTLQEIVQVAQEMLFGTLPERPMVCNHFWKNILMPLFDSPYVTNEYQRLVHFTDSPEEMVEYLVAQRSKISG